MKYFSYDPEDGYETHTTENEASKRADNALELYRSDAYEGWHEDVEQVCWGKIIEKVERTKCEKAPDDSEFDEIWDFDLVPVEDKQK